jgi:DNA invertase Pin-like site-specific DNA recombinase
MADKVALYARTSMADQNTDTQLLPLRDYCQRLGYQAVGEYVDHGWSGKDDRRPEFERLLQDVRSGKINCILVFKLDRIGRSLRHLLNLFDEFKSKKVEFVSLTQNINTSTAEGRMFWQMLGVFAEYERELIVARTLSGLERAKRQGKTLGRPKGKKDSRQRKRSGYLLRWAEDRSK